MTEPIPAHIHAARVKATNSSYHCQHCGGRLHLGRYDRAAVRRGVLEAWLAWHRHDQEPA